MPLPVSMALPFLVLYIGKIRYNSVRSNRGRKLSQEFRDTGSKLDRRGKRPSGTLAEKTNENRDTPGVANPG